MEKSTRNFLDPLVRKAVWVYTAWVSIPLVLAFFPFFWGGIDPSTMNGLIPIFMWLPALSAFLVLKKLIKPQRITHYLAIGPVQSFPRLLLQLLSVIAGGCILVFLTLLISHVFGFITVDMVEWKGFLATNPGISSTEAGNQVQQTLKLLPVYIIAYFILSTGEELGWRGFLHTALTPLGFWKASLFTAVFWVLWHLPVIVTSIFFDMMSLNDGIVVSVNLFFTSFLISGLRERTGLVWPAVMGHALLNTVVLFAFSAFKVPFEPNDQFSFWGFSGVNWFVWIVAIFILTADFSKKRS